MKLLPRHAAMDWLVVLVVAALPRLLGYFTLPIIITNDSLGYLAWGETIASGGWPDLPVERVPGYPVFLAGVFGVFGTSAHAITLAQSVLGVCSALLAWRIARRTSGRAAGMVAGVAIALEPWCFMFEHYALTESLTLFLVLGACAAALGDGRWPRLVLGAFLAGVCIIAAVLTRPAMLAWVPFVGLACVLSAPSPRRAAAPAMAFAVGVMVSLTPWLAYNKTRDVNSVVQTDGLAMWGGLARAGLLSRAYPLPEGVAPKAAALYTGEPPSEDAVLGFYHALDNVRGIDRGELLRGWVSASIDEHRSGYANAVMHAAVWQSNAMLPSSPYTHDELRWFMQRLGLDGTAEGQPAPNVQISRNGVVKEHYYDRSPIGPQAWLYRKWSIGMARNVVHPVLGFASFVCFFMLVKRRKYAAAALLLGSFALVAGHAVLLQPFSRYSMTAWALWWCGLAMLIPTRKTDVEPATDAT